MSLDFAWGDPDIEPELEHDYAEGSVWRALHPHVFSRLLAPSSQGEVRWIYWCPVTKKEGILSYMKRPKKRRRMQESWIVGEYPYTEDLWWCFQNEREASQVLCSVLLLQE